VHASLLDLERGVVVSIPGAPDESIFQTLVAAGAGLQDLTRTVELPDRYVES
jgi:hypothetical protein